jgi:hypothetical protein
MSAFKGWWQLGYFSKCGRSNKYITAVALSHTFCTRCLLRWGRFNETTSEINMLIAKNNHVEAKIKKKNKLNSSLSVRKWMMSFKKTRIKWFLWAHSSWRFCEVPRNDWHWWLSSMECTSFQWLLVFLLTCNGGGVSLSPQLWYINTENLQCCC